MRRLTKKELAQYNGKDGTPAFIAYEGKVYDVSRSFLWQNGQHQILHMSGVNLTADLDQAPPRRRFVGKISCGWSAGAKRG